MKNNHKILLFIVIAVLSLGCDRVTKIWAKENLQNQLPKSYLNDTFRLQYAENTGAALSLGDDLPQPWSFILLSLLPSLFMLGVIIYAFYNIRTLDWFYVVCLSLIAAGGIGNIIDRILYDRRVTDFMLIQLTSTLRTGIFNVADVCITIAAIGLLLHAFIKPTATKDTSAAS